MSAAVRVLEIATATRPVRLRMPFRFGVVTLTEARQLFVRVRVALGDGRTGEGFAAELMVPKWFDKSPELSNADNEAQLERAVALAVPLYLALPDETPFGLHAAAAGPVRADGDAAGLPALAGAFGPALIDRAVLDGTLRLLGIDVFAAVADNLVGLDAALTPDLEGFDIDAALKALAPAKTIAVRHTVGLLDPIRQGDITEPIGDTLPQSLEAVIAAYGVRHFKLKVSGDLDADVARLTAIAGVLDALPAYVTTLDGNEQFASVDGILALWEAIAATPALARLAHSVELIEQPIARKAAMEADVGALAAHRTVEIDESDDSLDAFVRAKALGYRAVSSKACKGFYRALLNRLRCEAWSREGAERYTMSAEDLTTQAGLAVQQDLALATLIGCRHVERNGHHYVDGMSAAPEAEQAAFAKAHADLYRLEEGTARLAIRDGRLSLGSLWTPGLASAVVPDLAFVPVG